MLKRMSRMVLAALVLAGSAAAQTEGKTEKPAASGAVIQRLTGEDFLAIVQEIGWAGELNQTEKGVPVVVGLYKDEAGNSFDFQAGLYRCEESKGCFDIVFTRSFEAAKPVTLQMVNAYNQSQLFGCAYLNPDGKVGISMSHTIQGGVTRQTVKEILDWWREVMVNAETKIAP